MEENFEEKEDRKLVTIETIRSVRPVENSDFLDVVEVRGWEVVTKRGEHQVGDRVFYIEIDSLLPEKECFAFLERLNYRIKTIRLRGQVSQGIVFPLSIQEDFEELRGRTLEELEELDLTTAMGVKKYVRRTPGGGFMAGYAKGWFPGFLRKTDEPRLQNVYHAFNSYLSKLLTDEFSVPKFYMTEKLEGTSMTVYRRGEFGVCSRNLEIKLEPETSVLVKKAFDLRLHETLPDNLCVQGELVGPGIQGNYYGLSETKFYVYQIYDIELGVYLNLDSMLEISNELNLEVVPIVGLLSKEEIFQPLADWLKKSTGRSVINPKKLREGLVVRSSVEVKSPTRGMDRLSFKVVSNEYLLKNDA